MAFLELSGWIIGACSAAYAVYCQHKNDIAGLKSQHEIDRLKQELKWAISARSDFAKTVHDLCFTALLRLKNYPSDTVGTSMQREILRTALSSIQRVAQELSDHVVFQGEFIWGSDLGVIEQSNDISEVWLISRDLLPDAEDPELIEIVVENLNRGRRYNYVYPSDINPEVPDIFRTQLEKGSNTSTSVLSFFPVNPSENSRLFSGGSLAIYELVANATRRAEDGGVLAFEEAMLPNEKRGALWRRQDEVRASSLLRMMRHLREEAMQTSLPAYSQKQAKFQSGFENSSREGSTTVG